MHDNKELKFSGPQSDTFRESTKRNGVAGSRLAVTLLLSFWSGKRGCRADKPTGHQGGYDGKPDEQRERSEA
jgi:hypothetical protein